MSFCAPLVKSRNRFKIRPGLQQVERKGMRPAALCEAEAELLTKELHDLSVERRLSLTAKGLSQILSIEMGERNY